MSTTVLDNTAVFGIEHEQAVQLANSVRHRLPETAWSDYRLRIEPTAEQIIAAVAWSIIIEPGDTVAGRLVRRIGSVAALNAMIGSQNPRQFVDHICTITTSYHLGSEFIAELEEQWERWHPRVSMSATISAFHKLNSIGASAILPTDPWWPSGLDDLNLADSGTVAPGVLYVLGDVSVDWSKSVAIVGARAATGYGEHVAQEFAGELADSGHVIVSGGAYGIDGVAHRAVLARGLPTVAVLAGGLDRLYPSGNGQLFKSIVASGGLLVSENPPGIVPSKYRFLQRNRLIGAMSSVTVVVEAGVRSGSLHVAFWAGQIGRPVAAVPGPVTSVSSHGTNELLRHGTSELLHRRGEGVRVECVWLPEHVAELVSE